MKTADLERLEQDLDAVARRLGSRRSWEELGPGVRRVLGRPMRNLAGAIGLVVVCAAAGFWVPNAWMVASGLFLVVLPDRWRAVRERRRALAELGQGELFDLYRRELRRTGASHFARALLEAALALLFAVVGALAPDPRPGLIAAALLALAAGVRLLWLFPRPYRALRDLDRGEVAA